MDMTTEPTHTNSNPVPSAEATEMETKVVDILKTCFDPEIPVNIYDLGLIYEVKEKEPGHIYLKMTLTSPNCPVAESLPKEVEDKVRSLLGVQNVVLDLVWEPTWTMENMSQAAKLQLNML